MITKDEMLRAIQALPPEATVEDAVERLYFLAKVDRGVAQAEAGRTVTHDEARRRLARWLQ